MFRKGFGRGSNSGGLTPAEAHTPAGARRPGAGISRRSAVQWMILYPAAHALAQQPIRVSVNEVIVPVTVTDEKGRFVSNLDQQDFQIFDQGKLQQISYFSRERSQPVVVGFLLDLSNASRIQWKSYQDAAMELVLNLLPGDKKYSGYLIGYGNEAELMINTTSNADPIVEKMRKLKPGGGAALYDAIYYACTTRKLVQGEPVEPRRVLVIIGDGHDNASKHTLGEVMELAQRNLVTIYGISTLAYGFDSEGDGNLIKLVQETGGRVEYPLQDVYKNTVSGYLSTPSDEGNYALKVGTGGYASALSSSIFKSIANVAGEITTQYILRYNPDVPADSKLQFREINVKVALPEVTVRARRGYYAGLP
jgi:Ca-activated chloride channel homolog